MTATLPNGPYGAKNDYAAKVVGRWLWFMVGCIAVMVTIGGATRLTDSGLSITEWDLIMGSLPPLSEEAWQEALALYRQIPEYQLVNKGMSLDEFKFIYWWEWGHRFFGRFIGLAYLIPAVFFLAKGYFATTALKLKVFGVFILICFQGALGWYMVASGLSERVDVSQYRLAAHLGAAFILFCAIVWMALQLTVSAAGAGSLAERARSRMTAMFGLAVFGQIILGAFVAGLRAGKSYNTWPLMDGKFFPDGYFQGKADFFHAFETIAAVQFNHRIGAYLITLLAVALYFYVRKLGKPFSRYAGWILMAIAFQVLLGIWTLVAAVPISLGLIHQLGALGVLATILILLRKLQIKAA